MWKEININIQNIETKTSRAVLIKCPSKSKFAGWSFWHPAKLVRPGKHSYAVSVSYTDDFLFKLIKYGSGKTNKYQVIAEDAITAKELEEIFGIMNENIIASKEDESYLIVTEPKPIEIDEIIIPDVLKNE